MPVTSNIKYILEIAFIFIFTLSNSDYIFAQDKTSKKSIKSKTDTTKVKIDSVKKDSIPKYRSMNDLDVMKIDPDTSESITPFDKKYSDYFMFNDLLSYSKGFFALDMGNSGQQNTIVFDGLDNRHVNIFIDGIPFENSFFEIPDNLLFLPEDISKIEILPSSESFLFGKGGAAKSINIVTTKYNSSKPYTSLRHVEGPYETFLTDGIFSQNISRNSNLMAGFNYQTSKGRFTNLDYTLFNARTRLRFNFSNNFNLLISDYYYKYDRGLPGGIDTSKITPDKDLYEAIMPQAMEPSLRENRRRNDLNLILGMKLLPDSNDITRFTLSYISDKTDFEDPPDTIFNSANYSSSNLNLSLKQNFRFSFNNLFLEVGMNYLENSITPWNRLDSSINYVNDRYLLWLSFYDNIKYRNISLNIFTRYASQSNTIHNEFMHNPVYAESFSRDISNFSYGMNAEWLLSNFKLRFELSDYYRDKNIFEYSRMKFPEDIQEQEKHIYSSFGGTYFNPFISININYYQRDIANSLEMFNLIYKSPIVTENSEFFSVKSRKLKGLDLMVKGKFWKINYESKFNYIINKYSEEGIIAYDFEDPKYYFDAGLYFQDTIINKDLNIKFGFNGKYYSDFSKLYHLDGDKIIYSDNLSRYGGNGIINFFAMLNIETVSIYITIENLFDKKYFLVPFYPMNDRCFNLAVSWSFND